MKLLSDGNVSMTFDEYDLYTESAQNCGYAPSNWYPSMRSAEKLIEKFQDNITYIIWLIESQNKATMNETHKKVLKYLEQETKKKLILV